MAGYRHAFKLSKEAVTNATPPGTVQLIELELQQTGGRNHAGHEGVKRFPQPSIASTDPLNWAPWRKISILCSVSMFAFLSNFQSSIIASALPILMRFYRGRVPFSELTHLISVNVLFLGASNLWWVPLANTFGRRPIVLLSLLILCLASIWGGVATTFDSLLAARAIMGIGGAAAETVGPDIIGEVFFVHQRGRAMAFYTVHLAVGSLVGGLTGSYIAADHGWRWIQWTCVILSAINLVFCFFLQPETLFDRASAMSNSENSFIAAKGSSSMHGDIGPPPTPRPFTFARSLKIGTYRPGLVHQFIAPWLTLRFPGVWMVMLQYAGVVAGIVTISTVGPQLVSVPPYLWGHNAGLINVGGIIGAVLGAIYTYFMVDSSLKSSARKEFHGYAEPEARLITLFPGLIMATFGLWIFGACAANPGPGRWVGLEVGLGMVCFGLMQAPSVGFNYVMEAYNAVSGDCFVMICFFRSLIGFAWTFFVADWVRKRGAMEPFGIFGMLMAIFTLLTVPQYIWGKRTRIATARWVPTKADH